MVTTPQQPPITGLTTEINIYKKRTCSDSSGGTTTCANRNINNNFRTVSPNPCLAFCSGNGNIIGSDKNKVTSGSGDFLAKTSSPSQLPSHGNYHRRTKTLDTKSPSHHSSAASSLTRSSTTTNSAIATSESGSDRGTIRSLTVGSPRGSSSHVNNCHLHPNSSVSGSSNNVSIDHYHHQRQLNYQKSAFLKPKKTKENLRIRFELGEPHESQSQLSRRRRDYDEPRPLRYIRYVGGSEEYLNSNSGGLDGSNFNPGFSPCPQHDIVSHSLTLPQKKPKRSRSLKKILIKSKSFLGVKSSSSSLSIRQEGPISRAELVAKYNQEQIQSQGYFRGSSLSLGKGIPCPDLPEGSDNNKHGRDFYYSGVRLCPSPIKGHIVVNQNNNNISAKRVEFQRHERIQRTTQGPRGFQQDQRFLASGGEIGFPGRYSKFPSDKYENDDGAFMSNSSGNGSMKHERFAAADRERQNRTKEIYFYGGVNPVAAAKKRTKVPPNLQRNPMALDMDLEYHPRHSHLQQKQSYYDCKIPRPKLKFLVPTHSYGVSRRIVSSGSRVTVELESDLISKKNNSRSSEISGFSEISLTSDANEEDGAYGTGSGSSADTVGSFSNSNSVYPDETLSEFEREQEEGTLVYRGQDDDPEEDEEEEERGSGGSQVERNHSTEDEPNSRSGQFPIINREYSHHHQYNDSSTNPNSTTAIAIVTNNPKTTTSGCKEGGVANKGNSRRLLSFKKAYLPSLRSRSSSTNKGKLIEQTEFLKSVPLFRKVGSGFLMKISDHISEGTYQPGECIARQGNEGKFFFVLTSGTAKVTFLSTQNGEEIYLRTLHPGDSFGEKSLQLQGDRVNMTNVIANDGGASCIVISEQGFEQLLAKSVDFRLQVSDKIDKVNNFSKEFERLELEDLRLISTLGIGGFGRVELVTLASDPNRSFALKQMKKCQIVSTRQVAHIKSEKGILMETNCDFITKLYKTFKDAKYLYMLMECCLGGELWTILRDRGNFDDATARFYVGCVLEALKYLHSRNIIYRDLKPENLLLDPKGYLKLVDFGFAKKLEGKKTWTFCGTPEYVAPEIILNKGHDVTADYWSLGVLMYELLTGTPPFVGGDPMRTYKLILNGTESLNFPATVGKNAYSLIRKLCQENPLDRLGAQRGGINDIRKHKWFDGLDWQALRSKTLPPPIKPYVRGPHDCGNFDEYPPDKNGAPPDDLSGWDWDF